MIKKIIGFVLSGVLSGVFVMGAWAQNHDVILPEILGVVYALTDEGLHAVGVPMTENGSSAVMLNMDDAIVFDLTTGRTAAITDIHEGMAIRAAYWPAADTEPIPRGNALFVYLHAGEPEAAAFAATVSDNVQYDYDGSCIFLTDDGKYRVIITPDATVLDANGTPMPASAIEPGMTMFLWVDWLTASFPGLTYPDKAVLIAETPSMYTDAW